jgi:trimethylamine--corrinoid protein Co-methyltransferase
MRAESRKRRNRRKSQGLEESKHLSPPVWPGVEGGRYRPLSQSDEQRIHETVLDLLERVGLSRAIPPIIKLVVEKGGRLTENDRLLFPRALVEDMIANVSKSFVLYGRDGGLDMEASGNRIHVGTGGASPNIVDLEDGEYRDA